MYVIESITGPNGVELLPAIQDTEISEDFKLYPSSLQVKRCGMIYSAIFNREMFYQFNRPLPLGDPEYLKNCGVVEGMLTALSFTEKLENGYIVIRNGRTTYLKIKKIRRPFQFDQTIKDYISQLERL